MKENNGNYVLKGFLFSLGLLPLVLLSIWLFHNWPLLATGLDAMDEFAFDKSQLVVAELKLSRSDGGMVIGLGSVTNHSNKECSFIQLESDLLLDNKVIAHETAVVSALSAHATRGYNIHFTGVPEELDLTRLKVQIAVAQAFNLDAEAADLK